MGFGLLLLGALALLASTVRISWQAPPVPETAVEQPVAAPQPQQQGQARVTHSRVAAEPNAVDDHGPLIVPVAGVARSSIRDTWGESRGGGLRAHQASDIMAPGGTAVIAAAPGTIEKLFYSNGGGGITAYVRSPDMRWTYYYAHLQSYAPGLAEGQQLKRGQLVGRVGHTGNASAEGPHLHFAINRMQPNEKWYQGSPINPYPLLAGRKVSG